MDKYFYYLAKNRTFALYFKADFMAKNKGKNTQPDILEEGSEKLSNIFNNAEYFFEQYKNIILGVVAVLVIGVGGFWAYKNFVKGPQENKAKDAIVYAQKYFEMDSMCILTPLQILKDHSIPSYLGMSYGLNKLNETFISYGSNKLYQVIFVILSEATAGER